MEPLARLEEVVAEALRMVEPSPEEEARLEQVSTRVLDLVEQALRGVGVQGEVVPGGSYAKGTWLKGYGELDVFIRLPLELGREGLSRVGLEVGLKALQGHRTQLRYAEHPYVEGWVDGVRVNLVPCFMVERGRWITVADRSPYHTELVKSALDTEGRRAVRLLKAFLRGIGAYGAEVAVQGFSGYVCEVLVLRYGSFLQVLEAAARWREREVVSLEPPDPEVVKQARGPLVILDPVDPSRNLGAAIGAGQVARFTLAARHFLAAPRIEYFTSLGETSLEVMATSPLMDHLYAIHLHHDPRSPDIIWGQLHRSLKHLTKQLERAGFRVARTTPVTDEVEDSFLLFLIENPELPRLNVRRGPEYYRAQEVERFLTRNLASAHNAWIGQDGRVYTAHPRPLRLAAEYLHHLLAEGLSDSGVAPGLKGDVASRGFRVLKGVEVVEAASSRPWLARVVQEFVLPDWRITCGGPGAG